MSSPIQLHASADDITSITVFQSDRAEITRTFTVPLQSGQNKVAIIGLSSYIDVDSVRITGLGEARLFEASCKIQKRETWRKTDSSSDSERIRILSEKKALLGQEKNVCESASSLLRDYGKTLTSEHITPAEADTFIDQYLARGSTLARTAAKLGEEILQVQREIDAITAEGSMKDGETDGEVNITVMAKREAEVLLKVIYVVRQVQWKPFYELHAHADESGLPASSVSLQYKATIMQSTGETWDGVALALSTASPTVADESIPELKPTRISPPPRLWQSSTPKATARSEIQPQSSRPLAPIRPSQSMGQTLASATPVVSTVGALFGGHAPSTSAVFGGAFGPGQAAPQNPSGTELSKNDEPELVESPSRFEPTTSIAKESPFFVLYKIDGKSSVPSDGEIHKVSIAELPFDASISHIVVPKVKAVVYLEAKVKNTSEYRLIPGPVNVFFDDSFVSKTFIKDIASGGEFTCTLGSDMGTRITYKRTSKLEKESKSHFSKQFATTAYTALTTISNTHSFPLNKLIVRDGLPISDDENVRVILREPSALAEMEQGEQKEVEEHKLAWRSPSGRKDGLYEWQCSLDAGKEITLSTTWDVKAPAGVKWIEAS